MKASINKMSLPSRFKILPIGVLSKNLIGHLIIRFIIMLNNFLEALIIPLEDASPDKYAARP